MSFKFTWKIHLLCLVISYGICLAMKEFITSIFLSFYISNKIWSITSSFLVNVTLLILVIFVPITIIHELIHGTSYQLFGGKVKYRFKGIYAFTQETSGIILHRTQFLIVLISPLTLISLTSLFIPGEIRSIVFLLNLIGSTGDILMAFYLLRTNSNSYIIDKRYGFDIINKSEII